MAEKKGADKTWPILAAFVSLILPGVGLLFSRQNKILGVVILVLAVVADAIIFTIGAIGALCVVGAIVWLLIPVVHILAAIHTYDVFMKERKGKPIVFH